MMDVLGLAPAGQGSWRRHFQALQHPAAGRLPRRNRPPVAAAPQFEVSICCHKTCKAQGSKQVRPRAGAAREGGWRGREGEGRGVPGAGGARTSRRFPRPCLSHPVAFRSPNL